MHYLCFLMQKIVEDPELGLVVLRKYPRSRSYTIRLRRGKVSISLPLFGSYRYALEILETHRTNLLKKIQLMPEPQMTDADEKQLRQQAQAYLPGRLQCLAQQHGFTYLSLRINKSRGRWGSCSSQKRINLSLYLMTLPVHLIDYVILHELCHTKEMNHSPDFWRLMNEVTNGKALIFRKELKEYARSCY